MTIDGLANAARKKPFRPFSIFMSDGRKFEIAHPEMIATESIGRTVVIYSSQQQHLLDLLHITDIVMQRPA